MTKTEAQRWLRKLGESLSEVQSDLDCLKGEAEDTYDSIEPYEGRDELTPQQEERKEWFEELVSALDEAYDSLQEALDRMEEME